MRLLTLPAGLLALPACLTAASLLKTRMGLPRPTGSTPSEGGSAVCSLLPEVLWSGVLEGAELGAALS